jgi:hypothetical protein
MGLMDLLTDGGSQTTEAKIPGWLESSSRNIAQDVRRLRVAGEQNPLNAWQTKGLNQTAGIAGAGNGAGGAANAWLNNLLKGNGLNGQQTGLANNLIAGNIQNPALAETRRVAMGGDMGNNPWLAATYAKAGKGLTDQFNQAVIPGQDTSFASSGRLGSGAYAALRNKQESQLGTSLGDLATGIYGGAYQSDQANRMGALNQWGQMGQQGINNQLAGSQLYQQGQQNQQAGIGLGQNVQSLRYDDANRLMGAGQYQQEAPWQVQRNAAGIMSQLAHGTTQTQNQTMNPLSQLIGWGTAIGGAAAGMSGGGAAAASDRRVKRDITRIGSLPSGLPAYTFAYIWDEPGAPLHTGVMAQEAAELFPDAVSTHAHGYLMVDYSKVG